ncbi:hypothetical protein FDUTEX481_09912 [Tolypothrix sp. PCC 7601]|nr:hypothetical protein FDUTEX481_09912 [Tolypothrix sp. PCC 7601]
MHTTKISLLPEDSLYLRVITEAAIQSNYHYLRIQCNLPYV